MVPAAIVLLACFPTLPNGKVDRKALPTPTAEDWNSVAFVAPRTETEHVLAAIWADMLKQAQVGVYDNFFALGGHSLLVTELIFRLQAALGLEIGVRTIFEHPTIAELAERIDEQTLAEVDDLMLAQLLTEVDHAEQS
jgi:acyl carrier protein